MDIQTSELKPYRLNEKLFENIKGTDFETLKRDIAARGIKTELHILPDYTVICGHQRLRAATELKLEKTPCKIINSLKTDDEIAEYVIKDNLLRRHLKPEQQAFLVNELYKLKVSAHGGDRKSGGFKEKSTSNDETLKDTYSEVAKEIGQSRATVHRLVSYAKACEKQPELRQMKVAPALRKVKIDGQKEDIKKLVKIEGKFNVVVIDPPWPEFGGVGYRGKSDYPTMSIEEIKKINIPSDSNCVLFLWVVDYYLKDALSVLESWGFERKTTLVWVKDKIGLGQWLRSQHELCFVATKGNPIFEGGSASTILNAPRGGHSEKPIEFYKLVEKTCSSYSRKLDYFARKKREGWEVYGDEVK